MAETLRVMSETPAETSGPGAAPDVLSSVLEAVRLTGAVLFQGRFSAPWALAAPPGAELAHLLMPYARRLVLFHVVARGHCWAESKAGQGVELGTHDIVILPHGDPHVMGHAPGQRALPVVELLSNPGPGAVPRLVHGGGGPSTELVCGFLHCGEVLFNPLLNNLPPMLRVRTRGAAGAHWFASSVDHLVRSAPTAQPGSAAVLARLAEVMFLEAIRQYMVHLPEREVGWLAGVRDPMVGRALARLHADPQRPWTVPALARCIGTSRSVLAQRFGELIGESPIRYLTRWRMQLAAKRLRDEPHRGMADIAHSVGYETEAAFSRAFKRVTGEPPTVWRARTVASANP